MEARDLTERRTVAGIGSRIVYDDIVSLRLRRKISVNCRRFDPPIGFRVRFETGERGLEFVFDRRLVLLARSARSPLESVELVEVEQLEHLFYRDVAQHTRAPERRIRHRIVGGNVASCAGFVADGYVLADSRPEEDVVARIREIFLDEDVALLRILENV